MCNVEFASRTSPCQLTSCAREPLIFSTRQGRSLLASAGSGRLPSFTQSFSAGKDATLSFSLRCYRGGYSSICLATVSGKKALLELGILLGSKRVAFLLDTNCLRPHRRKKQAHGRICGGSSPRNSSQGRGDKSKISSEAILVETLHVGFPERRVSSRDFAGLSKGSGVGWRIY
ncbi:hypothetical protein BSKO_10597 [Bryopsis sp. KO-2023]|nr:hypothetical protein BSKO_10597 [Bryopsis sp. KO-2023]